MLVRNLCCGVLLAALGSVLPAAAQQPTQGTTTSTSRTEITQDEIVLQGDTTPRKALPTYWGDTGLWFVPTAETLGGGKWSFSAFRANFDRVQGLTDVNNIGITGAVGLGDRFELFGSWKTVRLDRDVRPTFVPASSQFGGVSQDYPYVRRGWSKTLGGPVIVGAKWGLLAQGRGDAMSLAPRVAVTFPAGSTWASTNDIQANLGLVASRIFAGTFEVSGTAAGVLRGDPDEFRLSDGIAWGVGTRIPVWRNLFSLIEWTGEWVIKDNVEVINPPFIAEDGSIAPILSRISDPTEFKVGYGWQWNSGWFIHGGMNTTRGTNDQIVAGTAINHNGLGWDIRIGFHPGVMPPRQRVRTIKETTTITNTVTPPPAPAVAVNRGPTVIVTCDPGVVEVGGTSRCTAQATDPDGDPLTYLWTVPQGTVNPNNAQTTTFTAPNQTGNVPVTATVTDNRGGQATGSTTVQVIARRVALVFEDVHFDFDRFNLRPDALKILDDAVVKLQANPEIRITIEGHADAIGTQEYNLALGERRANSARDYLISRGVAAARIRTVSFGEDRPIADNNTAQGRAQNRRAHLVVVME